MFKRKQFNAILPRQWIGMIAGALFVIPAFAGVVTDGSVGAVQTLSGAMTIPQTLGRLAGNNLFHSFGTFNINTGESATFTTTTPTIANVISRVTGGTPSLINGFLKLTPAGGTPGFYFINPAGVTFGAGAFIDMPGAFHVSTADYVKFPDGNYYADLAKTSTFSTAAPESFGFLTAAPAKLEIKDGAVLRDDGYPIEISAGNILIDNATVTKVGTGPITLNANGDLVLMNGGNIYVTGDNASININASGNIVLANFGRITTYGSESPIYIDAHGSITLSNRGFIQTGVNYTLPAIAGSITVKADSISLSDNSQISSSRLAPVGVVGAEGKTGNIELNIIKSLTISNGSFIIVNTNGISGAPGNIKIRAGSLLIGGNLQDRTGGIQANTYGNSDGGSVDISVAGNLSIIDMGFITSSTRSGTGNGGSVVINAGSIYLEKGKGNVFIDSEAGLASAQGAAGGSGNAGQVIITTSGNLTLAGGARINSDTFSLGNAGVVTISATKLVVDGYYVDLSSPSNISARAYGLSSGQTGNITVVANDITLSNGGQISIQNDATVADPSILTPTTITVTAPRITLQDASITAASTGNVAASNVVVNFTDVLHLDPSSITTSAQNGNGGAITVNGGSGLLWLDNSQITTSVLGLTGNGGDISINAGLLFMNTGFIQANTAAAGAAGGAVNINVPVILASGNNLQVGGSSPFTFQPGVFGYNVIQAAAADGVSGAINMTGPVLDVSGSLAAIGAAPLESGGLGRNVCETTEGSSLSSGGWDSLLPRASDPL